MGLYSIEDKIPGFRSGPLMHLGIFVKKKKGGGWITNEIESRWWESSFHLYGYAIKDGGFLGTLKEKIIYYPSLHCQPQGAWKFSPLCLLDAVLHFHNENYSLLLKNTSIFSKLLTLFHLLFHWPVHPHILHGLFLLNHYSSQGLLWGSSNAPSLSASYIPMTFKLLFLLIQPWPLSQASPTVNCPCTHQCTWTLQRPQNSARPELTFPKHILPPVFYISVHSTTYPSYWARVRESCLKLTDTHFIIFTS